MNLVTIKKDDTFPINVTDAAIARIFLVRKEADDLDNTFGVRIACRGGGCSGFQFDLSFDNEPEDSDFKKEYVGVDETIIVMVDYLSAPYLKGLTVNYLDGLVSGFKFEGGDNVKRTCGCGMSFSV